MRPAAFYSLRLLAGRTAALVVGAILSCWPSSGQPPVDAATLKIQFLHYVAQYAVWPKDALRPQDKQFVLGVLGENPFGDALDSYFRGKSVKSRSFAVRHFKTIDEVKACHMLFVSASEKNNFAEIVGKLEDIAVLTISDSDGFIQKNGMMFMFITEQSEISGGLGWDINPQAMKKARLQIDPFFIEKRRKPNR